LANGSTIGAHLSRAVFGQHRGASTDSPTLVYLDSLNCSPAPLRPTDITTIGPVPRQGHAGWRGGACVVREQGSFIGFALQRAWGYAATTETKRRRVDLMPWGSARQCGRFPVGGQNDPSSAPPRPPRRAGPVEIPNRVQRRASGRIYVPARRLCFFPRNHLDPTGQLRPGSERWSHPGRRRYPRQRPAAVPVPTPVGRVNATLMFSSPPRCAPRSAQWRGIGQLAQLIGGEQPCSAVPGVASRIAPTTMKTQQALPA